MRKYSTLVTNSSITINKDGQSVIIKNDHKKYADILSAIKDNNMDVAWDLSSNPISDIEKLSNGQLSLIDNQVFLNTVNGKIPVATGLNETILYYINNNLPFQSLVNFAVKLNQNPSNRSINELFSFLDNNKFTLTEDGNFIAYKKVRNDYKDLYTGTMDNSIGQIVSMPRNQVNDDCNQTCQSGLHVAAYSYAHDVYCSDRSDTVVVFVEVNPKDVVSIPIDYNHAKMRVCEYKVLGISAAPLNQDIYQKSSNEEDSSDLLDEEVCDECSCEENRCEECGTCYYCDDCSCEE